MNKQEYNKAYGLLPFPTIIAAHAGDVEAIEAVLTHYESYICALSTRPCRNAQCRTYHCVDETLRCRLESKLISAILVFRID